MSQLGDAAVKAIQGEAATAATAAVHEVHEHLHRHHMHLPVGASRSSGKGLIGLLVFAHLVFVGYLLYAYWRQRSRAPPGKKEPERVNCVYEFALPQITLPQTGRGMLGLGQGEKVP